MRLAPTNWAATRAETHKVEYFVNINGMNYRSENMLSAPIITRPLLDKPAIGRVCSATMTVTVRPITEIAKAAVVQVYCRLVSKQSEKTTAWLLIGRFFVSSRSRSGNGAVTLNCRDAMIMAGQPYLAKSSIENWPKQQTEVVNDIARIMGVELDDNTALILKTGTNYRASTPDNDALISEVLSHIGVCNGGNWIITEEGKLRLVRLASPSELPRQALGTTHSGFSLEGIDVTISRVTLTDREDETYTAGDESGYELTAYSPYASQAVADDLYELLNGTIYRPYRLDVARIDPLLELGDTISAIDGEGNTYNVILNAATITCNVGYTAMLESKSEDDNEEEIPYQTAQELQAARSIRADRSYYGTSLNRGEGLVVRKLQGDSELAKVIFNADKMAFYQGDTEVLYFDAETGHWKMSGSMDITTTGSNITTITDINDRTLTIEETVNGITITNPQTGETLIDGGSIWTDNLFLNRLFSRDGHDSYVEMLENGLNFILGQAETIGIGYYSSDVPLPYMIFGAGSSPKTNYAGMIKKYSNGIWIGDSTDRYSDTIKNGTGLFVDTVNHKIYKYFNGISAELADTSNVTAVFG